MNVLIIGERRTTLSQLRFALSAARHPCTVTCLEASADLTDDVRKASRTVELILVAVPAEEQETVQLIKRLRPLSGARLVAVGMVHSPQQILGALHAGADDFLDEAGDLREQVANELERVAMHTKAAVPDQQGRLITVTGSCGGVGATLTAANLAVACANRDRSCGLIDLSGGFGELASLLSLHPQHSLADLCSNLESLDAEMLTNAMTEHISGVTLIASATNSPEWEAGSTEAMSRIVQTACQLLPTLVVDLNRRAPFGLKLLASSDLILLLTTLDFKAACATRCLLEYWRENGIDLDRVVLVATRTRRSKELDPRQVENLLDHRFEAYIVEDCEAAYISVNCGNPVLLEQPNSSLAIHFDKLTKVVRQRLGTPDAEDHYADESNASRMRRSASDLVSRAVSLLF